MRKFAASSILAAALLSGAAARGQMSETDIRVVLRNASSAAANFSPKSAIAVLDREGYVLAVWFTGPDRPSEEEIGEAIASAGTAAYLSSNGHAFTSRTAGFIVAQHFPPDIRNRPPGPLVGVNNSNLSFSDVNHFKIFIFRPARPAVPLMLPLPSNAGRLSGTPGGVPLYKNGRLIGGLGVSGAVQPSQVQDVNEIIALAGQRGFEPSRIILGSHVTIDGIRLPYVETDPDSISYPLRENIGAAVPGFAVQPSPLVNYPKRILGGVEGEVRQPIISDPLPGLIENESRLSAEEVETMLGQAAARAEQTRAGIRLPAGRAAQVFITVVNNPVTPGVPATVLGTFRTPDATLFSWDVAVQKARTALYFSSRTLAISTRAVGFLAQSMLPPGIENTAPGPLFGFQERVSTYRDPALPNGITIFPGGFPLYRNGVLIGAIGISGDGVDQDDLIGMSGAAGFLPPDQIRSDRFEIRGARLPYAKFPRNPSR